MYEKSQELMNVVHLTKASLNVSSDLVVINVGLGDTATMLTERVEEPAPAVLAAFRPCTGKTNAVVKSLRRHPTVTAVTATLRPEKSMLGSSSVDAPEVWCESLLKLENDVRRFLRGVNIAMVGRMKNAHVL